MKYAVSALLYLETGISMHSVFVVEADSEESASSKGILIGRKAYPASQGWSRPHVAVCSVDHVVSVEGAEGGTPY